MSRVEMVGVISLYLRQNMFDYIDVVEMSIVIAENQHTKTNLVDSVGHFFTLVSRVDVDKDEVSNCSCYLNYHPFIFVVGIDADTVSWF